LTPGSPGIARESSGYSYFVPEEDLTYAGRDARLRISPRLKDKCRNSSIYSFGNRVDTGLFLTVFLSAHDRGGTRLHLLDATEKVAAKLLSKN
jgi:hypothetical protein